MVGHPEAEFIGLEAAAVHHGGVLVEGEDAADDPVVVYVVGEEESVFGIARAQKNVCGIVVDAAAVDRKAIGIGDLKETRRMAHTRAGAVAVDLAGLQAHVPAAAERDGVHAAFVDAAGADVEIIAVHRPDAHGAAAEEAAAENLDAAAVFQAQHAAHAEARLRGVPGGQARDGEIPAADKANDIGVARLDGEGGLAHPRAPDAQTVDPADDQLRIRLALLAPDAVPGVVAAVGVLPVVRRGGEIVLTLG